MYKEHFELKKIRSPEDLGHPGKPYCVYHYKPQEGGTWLACTDIKYFATQEEAEAFLKAQEEKLLKKGRNAMTKTKEPKKAMSEAAREARNAYHAKWAKENPEKVKAATARYWEKKAQEATVNE